MASVKMRKLAVRGDEGKPSIWEGSAGREGENLGGTSSSFTRCCVRSASGQSLHEATDSVEDTDDVSGLWLSGVIAVEGLNTVLYHPDKCCTKKSLCYLESLLHIW
jgi:hypothetical protein